MSCTWIVNSFLLSIIPFLTACLRLRHWAINYNRLRQIIYLHCVVYCKCQQLHNWTHVKRISLELAPLFFNRLCLTLAILLISMRPSRGTIFLKSRINITRVFELFHKKSFKHHNISTWCHCCCSSYRNLPTSTSRRRARTGLSQFGRAQNLKRTGKTCHIRKTGGQKRTQGKTVNEDYQSSRTCYLVQDRCRRHPGGNFARRISG